MRVWVLLLLVGACADDFKLVASLEQLGSNVDHVRFQGADIPVVGTVAKVEAHFDSYADALAAPPMPVEFESRGATVYMGTIAAGACRNCVYSGCPTQDELTEEDIEFIGSDVGPHATWGFTCIGGGKTETATP